MRSETLVISRRSMRWTAIGVLGLALVASGFGDGQLLRVPGVSAQEATPTASVLEESPGDTGSSDPITPVLMSVIGGDTAPVRGSDGQYYVVYELLLTNTLASPATLEAIAVLDAANGREVVRLTGDEVVKDEYLRQLDRAPATDAILPPDAGRILMLTVTFATEDDVPAALSHRLDTEGHSVFSTEVIPDSYVAAPLDLSRRRPPVLS